jgi:hypothetical protein
MLGRAITLAVLLTSSLGAACSIGPIEISSQPLSGVIGGAPWTLAGAESNAFLSKNSPTFFVTAYGESLTACTGAGSATHGNLLILNLPKIAGDYRLTESLTQTFFVVTGNINYVAIDGRVIVDEVTSTNVRAQAHFRFDDANEVDGQFAVTICPEM